VYNLLKLNVIFGLMASSLAAHQLLLPPSSYAETTEQISGVNFSLGEKTAEPKLVQEPAGSDSKSFFTKGSAASTFEGAIELTKQIDPQMLNSKSAKKEEEKTEFSRQNSKQLDSNKKDAPRKVPQSKDDVLLAYGSPDKDVPVLGKADTPKPISAMMDALEIGDNELAYQYARQYARYMRGLDQRASRIAKLSDLAMQSEGMKPLKPQSEDPEYDEVQALFQNDLKKQEEWSSKRLSLDDATTTMINRAIAEEDKSLHAQTTSAKEKALNTKADSLELKDRQTIRTEMLGKVPRDPKGQVDVYLFFRKDSNRYGELFMHFNQFALMNKDSADVNAVAMSLDYTTPDQLSSIAKNLNLLFPVRDGSELARRAKIEKHGTLLFVARNTGEALVEEGGRNYLFIDEVARMMRGK
jgi:hypothetical protein